MKSPSVADFRMIIGVHLDHIFALVVTSLHFAWSLVTFIETAQTVGRGAKKGNTKSAES